MNYLRSCGVLCEGLVAPVHVVFFFPNDVYLSQ